MSLFRIYFILRYPFLERSYRPDRWNDLHARVRERLGLTQRSTFWKSRFYQISFMDPNPHPNPRPNALYPA
jgi:hypothetical protein